MQVSIDIFWFIKLCCATSQGPWSIAIQPLNSLVIVFKNRILPLFQISTYKFARLISHCDVGSPPHLFESKELKLKFSKTMDPFPDRSEIRFTDLLLFICGDGMGIVHHTHSIPLSIIRGVFWSRTIPGHRFQCCSMTIFQGTSISGYPPFFLNCHTYTLLCGIHKFCLTFHNHPVNRWTYSISRIATFYRSIGNN